MKGINARIKKYRLEKGYTLKDVEELTGISSSSLQRYETSEKNNISAKRLALIAQALDVTVEVLLGNESKELPLEEFFPFFALLQNLQYKCEYNSEKNSYLLYKNSVLVCVLTAKQMKTIADNTSLYFEFELQKMINKNNK